MRFTFIGWRRLTLLSVTFLLLACRAQLEADFKYTPTHPLVGEAVAFVNTSEHAKSFSWNFGDGTIVDEENPTHAFNNPGSYSVSLTAGNGNRTDTKVVVIVVN